MTKEEMQKQVLDAITSGKIQATNIIFGDNVQNKIENVEEGGIGIQIVNNSVAPIEEESSTTAFTPKDKRGPKYQVLFADKNGDEDSNRTRKEKERLLSYLRDNGLMSLKLSSSKHDELTQTIVCFCKKWVELKYASSSFSSTALARFLIETCGIDKKVNQVSLANVLKPILVSGKYDKEIYEQVCMYF